MSYVAVLDASSLVWDRADFETNTDQYFELKAELIQFIDKVESERPNILLRAELLNQMLMGFPYDQMPSSFAPFKNIVYGFLGKIGSELIQYNADESLSVTANPQVIKEHFAEEMVQEMKYLLNEMHSNGDRQPVYFTFKYLWGKNGDLKTVGDSTGEKEYVTIVSDEASLNKHFGQLKKVFCHSSKHHIGNEQGDYVSPLTCYKNNDATLAQKYLDESMQLGRKHFAYDEVNGVYIVFFCTVNNEYHGHDEINLNKIPAKVRMKFAR